MKFDQLRQIREAQKLSTQDVSLRTRIPALYVEALEQEKWKRLPPPVRTKNYINVYARFLKLDPEPFLQEYQKAMEQETQSIPASYSRTEKFQETKRRKIQKKPTVSAILANLTIPKQWLYIGAAVVAGLLIMVGIWTIFAGEENSSNHVDAKEENSDSVSYVSQERPIIKLVQTAESHEFGDVYELSNVSEIMVQVEGTGNARVRGEGPNGPILADKSLTKEAPLEFRHPKCISVHLERPAQVRLVVNGFVIETSNLQEAQTFQFKLADEYRVGGSD